MERWVNIHTHRPRPEELSPQSEGIHPWQADLWSGAEPSISADCEVVGEVGLDFACEVNRSRQEALLRCQLRLAERGGRPVVLHCVKAFEELMCILRDYKLQGVVFHGFIGSWQQAERALSRGYFLSFGERSFRSPRTMEVLRKIPLSHLFLESDESPTPIEEIYHRAAEIRGMKPADLAAATKQNYDRLLNRPKDE